MEPKKDGGLERWAGKGREINFESIIQKTYQQRGSGEELSENWKKIDKFGVAQLASTVFVKFFYIAFAIGIFFFVLALILFIVPVKSDNKVQEEELEEAISVWSYLRRSEAF